MRVGVVERFERARALIAAGEGSTKACRKVGMAYKSYQRLLKGNSKLVQTAKSKPARKQPAFVDLEVLPPAIHLDELVTILVCKRSSVKAILETVWQS